MLEQTVQIVSNERDTDSYFRLVLRAPQIAPLIQPGQFAHVRVLPLKDALLRRPFSIFQVSRRHVFHPLQNHRQGHGGSVTDGSRRGTQRHRAARPRVYRAQARRRNSPARRRRLWHGGDVSAGATLAAKRHRFRRRPPARGHFVRKGISRTRLGRPCNHRRRQSRRKRSRDPTADCGIA